MQKLYVSRITADYWTAKNNLEKAAKKLAKEMDCKLIMESELNAFKKDLRDKIKLLNQEFNRCKPLDFDIQTQYSKEQNIDIYCIGVFMMEVILIDHYNLSKGRFF